MRSDGTGSGLPGGPLQRQRGMIGMQPFRDCNERAKSIRLVLAPTVLHFTAWELTVTCAAADCTHERCVLMATRRSVPRGGMSVICLDVAVHTREAAAESTDKQQTEQNVLRTENNTEFLISEQRPNDV